MGVLMGVPYGQPIAITSNDVKREQMRLLIIETNKSLIALQRRLNQLERELNDSAA